VQLKGSTSNWHETNGAQRWPRNDMAPRGPGEDFENNLRNRRATKSNKPLKKLVPVERIELPTFGLQNRCSTAELNRQMAFGTSGNPDRPRRSLAGSNTRLDPKGLEPRGQVQPPAAIKRRPPSRLFDFVVWPRHLPKGAFPRAARACSSAGENDCRLVDFFGYATAGAILHRRWTARLLRAKEWSRFASKVSDKNL
jgi:hypothetical protein